MLETLDLRCSVVNKYHFHQDGEMVYVLCIPGRAGPPLLPVARVWGMLPAVTIFILAKQWLENIRTVSPPTSHLGSAPQPPGRVSTRSRQDGACAVRRTGGTQVAAWSTVSQCQPSARWGHSETRCQHGPPHCPVTRPASAVWPRPQWPLVTANGGTCAPWPAPPPEHLTTWNRNWRENEKWEASSGISHRVSRYSVDTV